MAQNITIWGASYSNVPAVTLPKTGGGTASFTDVSDTTAVASDVASGKYFYTSSGVRTQGTSSGGGSSKNIQYSMGRNEVKTTSYTSTGHSIKVSNAGTYKCYWVMDRNTTSGTNGSRIYKNGSAVGTAHTSWTYDGNNRNGAACEETLTLAANDTVDVYARARSTSYSLGVSDFIIIEQ